MSNPVTNLCRVLVGLTPAQKAVLMCLADRGNDDGASWPSVAKIGVWTCLRKTAVIEALKALEGLGLVTVVRRKGINNQLRINLAKVESYPQKVLDQPGKQTSPEDGPVRETDDHQSGKRTGPVRQTDLTSPANGPETSININTSEKHQAPRERVVISELEDVPSELLADYLKVRKAKKAGPITETVVAGLKREAAKAGISVADAITCCCEAGWQGFNAEWYAKRRAPTGRAPVAATPTHDPDSRAAIEAEGIALGLGPWNDFDEQWHVYKARVRGRGRDNGMTLDRLSQMAQQHTGAH